MALVTISGFPCSGKTTRASEMKEMFEKRIEEASYSGPATKVVLISDDTLGLSRQGYNDGRAEKPQRGALFSALQRSLTKSTIVIVDAPNYIKGFRYQMYCVAREANVRVATVYIATPADVCRQWHEARPEDARYTESTFENLIQRYEEPSSMVRWDSPLFTVPWNEESAPVEDIWQAITAGALKPPNAGTLGPPKPPSDALQALETTTSGIVSELVASQDVGLGSGGDVTINLASIGRIAVRMPARTVTLSEMQRLKRQFVTIHKKAITLGATESGDVDWTENGVAAKFVHYLEQRLQ